MSRRQRRASAAEPGSNRAVLYLRRSKDDGPGSLPVQQEAGQAYAGRAGLVIVETITDQESAYLDNSAQRAGYQRVLEMARAGAIHHIIVWQLTRFGRDAAEILARRRELHHLGVTLHSTSEDLTNKLLLSFLAVLAEEESDRISQRVTARKRQIAASGRFQGSHAPYGLIAVDGQLLPGPRFPVVRAVYELAVSGMRPRDIAAHLTRTFDLIPPLGSRQVWRILTNPAYVGVLRGELPDGFGETKGGWEPLIAPDLRQAALTTVRAARRPDYGRSYQTITWLRGLVFCGECGRSAHVARIPVRSGAVHYYFRCNGACVKVGYRMDGLESWVAERVRRLTLPVEDAPLVRAAVDSFNAEQDRASGTAELVDQRAALLARRERIENLIIDGTLDRGRGRERLRELEATLAALEARIALAAPPVHLDADDAVALFTSPAMHERRHTDPTAYAEAIHTWIAAVRLPRKPADPILEWTAFAQHLIMRTAVLL